jgi:adenylate kinase family enzyme
MMGPHIHILGASGSGTTTLGRALAARLGAAFFDTDDFFWLKTNPPFQSMREKGARQDKLRGALDDAKGGWVLSGSLTGWGDLFMPRFDLVVFLTLAPEIRMARLKAREVQRYGVDAIAPGGPTHQQHVEFLDWASRYDTAGVEMRSRVAHEAWLARLACPMLRLDTQQGVDALAQAVLGVPLLAAIDRSTRSLSSAPPA